MPALAHLFKEDCFHNFRYLFLALHDSQYWKNTAFQNIFLKMLYWYLEQLHPLSFDWLLLGNQRFAYYVGGRDVRLRRSYQWDPFFPQAICD